MASAPDVSTFRFSTDDLPERDRLAIAREVYGRSVVRLDLEPAEDAPFRVTAAALARPGLAVLRGACSSLRVSRTRELLADGDDNITLCLSEVGGHVVAQRGREVVMQPGAAAALSNADTASVTALAMSHCLNLSLSRKALAAIVPDLEDSFVRPIPKDSPALGLLQRYLDVVDEHGLLAMPELGDLVVAHVYDLVALALGAGRDVGQVAQERGVRAARLAVIKRQIAREHGTHGLSIAHVAARHGVTPRYVQRLFDADGTTFSQFLLEQRLARAHRMLRDPRFADRTISAIAFDAGFGDLSHFNRAFRRRYGQSPSDVRAATLRDRGG
jgi:AraC-like DNA-binding protein